MHVVRDTARCMDNLIYICKAAGKARLDIETHKQPV